MAHRVASLAVVVAGFGFAAGAGGPVVAQRVAGKAEIDGAARAAGFPESDYPYCSMKNGCGPDGWRNHLVPDLTHLLYGCDFSGACDRHDEDYMTVGVARDEADERFRLGLHAAIVRYVEQTRSDLAQEELGPGFTGRVSGAVERVADAVEGSDAVRGSAESWFFRRWWGWAWGVVGARGAMADACGESWDAAWAAGKAVVRATTLSDAQVAFMHWEADVYYDAVRRFGGGRYEASQADQARYDAWVREFLSGR